MKTKNTDTILVKEYGMFIPEKDAVDLLTNFNNDNQFIKVIAPKYLTDDSARGIIKFLPSDCKIVTPDEFSTVSIEHLDNNFRKMYSDERIPYGLLVSSTLQKTRKDSAIPYFSIEDMEHEFRNQYGKYLPDDYDFESSLVYFKGLKDIKAKRRKYEPMKYENIAYFGNNFNITGIDRGIYKIGVMNTINIFNLGYAYVTDKGKIRKEIVDSSIFYIRGRKLNILIYYIISTAIKKIYLTHEHKLARDYSINGAPMYSINWDHERHTITIKYGDIYTSIFKYEKLTNDYESIKDNSVITSQIKQTRVSKVIDEVLDAIYNNPVLPSEGEDDERISIVDYLKSIGIKGETLNKVSFAYDSLDEYDGLSDEDEEENFYDFFKTALDNRRLYKIDNLDIYKAMHNHDKDDDEE